MSNEKPVFGYRSWNVNEQGKFEGLGLWLCMGTR